MASAAQRPAAAVLALLGSLGAAAVGTAPHSNEAAFGNLPPATVSRFVPETSSSWRGNDALRFSSTYAQGTTVKGFLCSDYVQFPPLPPLFISLGNITGQDSAAQDKPVPKPVFSFLSAPDAAELQLGGYDKKSVKGDMKYVDSLSKYAYVVPVTSITMGDTQIFQPAGKLGMKRHVAGVLDSGTSCICLPDNDIGGVAESSPFKNFKDSWRSNGQSTLTITIDGSIDVEIPAEIWMPAMQQVKGCLMKDCPGDKVIIGDWLFQSWLALFDLGPTAHNLPPRIGLAARDPDYSPGKEYRLHEHGGLVTKVAMTREKVERHYQTPELPGYGGSRASVPDVELSIVHDLYYLLPVMVGQPPQRFDVVFDTGSSFFGLVTAPANSAVVEQALVKMGESGKGKLSKQLRREVDEAEAVRKRLDASDDGPLRERKTTGPGPGMVGVGVIGLVWGVLVIGGVCVVHIVRKRQRKGAGDWF